MLKRLLVGYDRLFGFSLPYMMVMHQAPTDGGDYEGVAHFHIEFYPPNRTADKLKYLAGSETGRGALRHGRPARADRREAPGGRGRRRLLKLLVTGGAGYIGSVVASQLARGGPRDGGAGQPLQRDTRGRSRRGAASCGETSSTRGCAAKMLSEGFDGVLHFAALSLVGESVEQPERYYRNNVCGTLNLLEAMRDAGVPRLVFSSTAAVYGEPEEVPIPEAAPEPCPTNPYGASKLAVDRVIGAVAAARGLSGDEPPLLQRRRGERAIR